MLRSKGGEAFGLPTTKDLQNVEKVETRDEFEELRVLTDMRLDAAVKAFKVNSNTENYDRLIMAALAYQNIQSNAYVIAAIREEV